MTIRTATEADLDQIGLLADEVAALHSLNEPVVFAEPNTGRDREFWLACIHQPDGTVHVANDGDEILGFITAKIATPSALPFLNRRTICSIGTIAVSSRTQRTGIGTELIDSIERWAKTKSATEIRLEVFDFNRQARHFYANRGYATQSQIMRKGLL
jgi:ribosomal protein S18 acetylase RimI-like enzyme